MQCKLILIQGRVCPTIYPKESLLWRLLKNVQHAIPKSVGLYQVYLENITQSLVRSVYRELSVSLQTNVSSASSECFRASELLAQKLAAQQLPVLLIRNTKQASQHGFVLVQGDEQFWLIDPTYQQFQVPPWKRLVQPPVLVFPISQRSDIATMLCLYSIPEGYARYWDCEQLQDILNTVRLEK